jgi:thiol-disulfide isomerase/thioredoxin
MRWTTLFWVVFLAGGMGLQAQSGREGQGPTDAKAQKSWQEGMRWIQQRNYAAAVDSFKKADKQDGGHCSACAYKIIDSSLKTNDFKDADAAAQQLIGDAQGTKEQALAHLERADVQFREGMVKNKTDCYAEADKEYHLTLAAYNNVPEACFYDGIALAKLNRDDEAKAQFAQYLKTAPAANQGDRVRAQRYLGNIALARARMAPAFSFTSLEGRAVSLDGLAGKVVLIDFWATWCGPCREALPHIREIAQRFQGQPLVVMSISLDKDDAAWRSFVAKNQMTWVQYRDGTGEIARLFAVHEIPHTFTIDADGVLEDEHVGDANLEGKLKKLCAQAARREEAPTRAGSL